MPNITTLPTPIHLEFPYDVTITTKEEAADYIINQCKKIVLVTQLTGIVLV